ncbi:branched-chain amino acid aminotransferase, partial [Bacteroidota bacterium]
FEMDYHTDKGWFNPTIKKRANLDLEPGAMALHYGQAIFEGMKAYNHASGKISLFRPEKNFERLNKSNSRLCMPEIDTDLMMEALIELIKIDKEWIPQKEDHALYIRPFVFASESALGVRPANEYKVIILLNPVGPYYPQGFKPVPIMVSDKYVRAVRKGVGDCKCAGNYAAGMLGQKEALKEGYSQVLWLDAIEQKYLEEVGVMNIFVRFKDEVATPNLTGSILPGITRMSTIQILKDWGYNVNERMISIDEVVEAYYKGELLEMFGTGTAAVISSISKLKFKEKVMQFNEEEAGELGTKLYNEITGIQWGKVDDKYGWIKFVE